jgi:hypothetical protein
MPTLQSFFRGTAMQTSEKQRLYTPEEYLALEKKQTFAANIALVIPN